MPSLPLPKLITGANMSKALDSPACPRDSLATSSPMVSPFSTRAHKRWPSSSSSFTTSMDSLTTGQKSFLDDLVEDPLEREDLSTEVIHSLANEPMCICDTLFCEHRQGELPSQSVVHPLPTPEWTPGDDYFGVSPSPGERSSKRRRSGEISIENFSSRLNRHLPSLSRRWRGHKSSASTSEASIRSAPTSRPPSLRLPSLARSLMNSSATSSPPLPPASSPIQDYQASPPASMSEALTAFTPALPQTPVEDPVDRQFTTTPLLPPMTGGHLCDMDEELQSPLQSPTVAAPFSSHSNLNTPDSTPALPSMPTPPLSARPSVSSLALQKPAHSPHLSSDIPHLNLGEETDPWAMKLGHANFYILPEPYLPPTSTPQTCARLRDDWESARASYMLQATRVREHYGPTSHIFKLTEQKWAAIDATWRTYHETTASRAPPSADAAPINYQPLAEMQPLAKMPSLRDPSAPTKFPDVDEADIVGPMVQMAKLPRRASKRSAILKIFTDPASLLGAHALGLR